MASRITSPFGVRQRPKGPRMHAGIDISGTMGQPVYALAPGVVTHATINGQRGFSNYGKTVVIKHDHPRVWAMYAHLNDHAVVPGQRVVRGTLLGGMGNTRGYYDRERRLSVPAFFHGSKPHLHFEVRTRSLPAGYGVGAIDPRQWLASMGLPLPTTPFGTVMPSPQTSALPVATPPTPIAIVLKTAAMQTGVPYIVLAAVAHAESRYNPDAISPAGAQGLMQLMPRTSTSLGVTNPFDPMQSAIGGGKFLRQLYLKYANWPEALAAYNWGPGNVDRHRAQNQWPESVRAYVATVMARSMPAKPLPTTPYPSYRSTSTAAVGAIVAVLGIGLAVALGRRTG